MTDYQIFISYRRSGGEYLAGRISDRLGSMGYKVFYDVESMRSGTFNTQIFSAIDTCEDILLILPPNGLDRCWEENDWVRQEIEYAMKTGKNIIPIMMPGFEFPGKLPPGIQGIDKFEAVKVMPEYFGPMVDKVIKLLKCGRPEKDGPAKASDLSNGVRLLNHRMYPQAVAILEQAMLTDLSNPDVYFYIAAALLQGKRPFLMDRTTIKRIEEYLGTAISINSTALYHYFLAYIRFDYHHKKLLRANPDYQELLHTARQLGITAEQSKSLFQLLGQPEPEWF